MSKSNASDYLEIHLYNDLRWLLCAAAEWQLQKTINRGIDGLYIQIYAMDSAALHARALLEFFTGHGSNRGRMNALYGIQSIASQRFPGDWVRPLNTHIMHVQDRTVGQRLTAVDGVSKLDLNDMPVEFGQEVVGCGDSSSSTSSPIHYRHWLIQPWTVLPRSHHLSTTTTSIGPTTSTR